MLYAIAIIIEAINALSGCDKVYWGMKYAIAYKIPQFIIKLNIPKVKKLIGKANNLIIGFINMFTNVKTAAISIANAKFSTSIPGR